MSFLSAPSAPPTHFNVTEVTSSSITIQWELVNCIYRNGDITGYSLQYGVEGSGSTHALGISGDGTTQITFSGLDCGTTYSIEVAAVNSAGTGVYSNALSVMTEGIQFSDFI